MDENNNQETNNDSAAILNENIEQKKAKKHEPEKISAMIWIPLGIVVAMIIAISNEIKSHISHYHFNARFLQAPGSVLANILATLFLGLEKENKESIPLLQNGKLNKTKCLNFDWFWNIFYERSHSDRDIIISKSKLVHSRVFGVTLLVIINIITYWTNIESYYHAVKISLNIGVLNGFWGVSPLISGILFYLLFGNILKRLDIVAIFLAIGSVVLITIANNSDNISNFDIKNVQLSEFTLAVGFMLITVVLVSIRNGLMNYFLIHKNSKISIVAVISLCNLVVSLPLTIIFIIMFFNGFKFTVQDFLLGNLGGFIDMVAATGSSFAVIRGKAGAADSLVQSAFIYQTIMDAIVFLRIPKITEIISILLALLSILLIIQSSRKVKDAV